MKIYTNIFEKIISLENLFSAWEEFKKDKQKKLDVQEFELHLEQNIFQLYRELKNRTYKHGPYTSFYVHDPKLRHIHKADVKDRVLHHAIFQILNPIFESTFISESFSCRVNKGTHKGVRYVEKIIRKVSKNHTKTCFILKCDIKKFFDSVDHDVLLKILGKTVKDKDATRLLEDIVESFVSERSTLFNRSGIPLGNLTSQLFANVYMNELDQFIKHDLKIKYYARYTDDFVVISEDEVYLQKLVQTIDFFLTQRLNLKMHPQKVSIQKSYRGVDFLGYIVLPHHKLVRAKTRKRMFRKVKEQTIQYKNEKRNRNTLNQSLQSYLGVLSHANTHQLSQDLKNKYWFWMNN
ncbi:reverse transcriptase/maturase family protein [Patescibacteria group bacterium]|nr:reverse transcriptase/maturase family protein [Patescibacteria group bacterium]MBU2633040.1 reverse transcriptase/maturase family protein [Patescibacteria group bacterium]